MTEQEVRSPVSGKVLVSLDACSRVSQGARSVQEGGKGLGSLKMTDMPPCCSLHGRASIFYFPQ